MAIRSDITPELCRQLLRYEPETGKLFWRSRPREMFTSQRAFSTWNSRFAGKEGFNNRLKSGHLQGEIFHIPMLAHRVIWAMVYGKWPDGVVDHKNRDPSCNTIANLRDIRKPDNSKNMNMSRRNTSGYNGVGWDKSRNKWYARLGCGKSSVHLGRFDQKEDAVAARRAGDVKYGYSSTHGRDKIATDSDDLEATPTGPASATVT